MQQTKRANGHQNSDSNLGLKLSLKLVIVHLMLLFKWFVLPVIHIYECISTPNWFVIVSTLSESVYVYVCLNTHI